MQTGGASESMARISTDYSNQQIAKRARWLRFHNLGGRCGCPFVAAS